jgi:phospholipase C
MLNGPGLCGSATATAANALPGVDPSTAHAQGRCGYGPRLPLLVISPWAKKNYIDSTVTDQTSILRFIEDDFLSGQRIGGGSFDSIAGSLDNVFDFSQSTPQNGSVVLLDDSTGEVTSN